jgi:hypothetical protein
VAWWDKVNIPPRPSRNDYIDYTTTDDQGVVKTFNEAPCYRGSTYCLGTHRFTVRQRKSTPNWRPFPEENIQRFIAMCKAHSLMPPDTTFMLEDGKPVYSSKGPAHEMYVGLCLFRYILSYHEVIDMILACMDLRPKISFYQAVHYATLYHHLSGHSFIDQVVLVDHNTHKPPVGKSIDLMHSVLLPHFLRYPTPETSPSRDPKYKPNGTSITSRQLDVYAATLNATVKITGPAYYGSARMGGLVLEQASDVLWDEFTPLYGIDQDANMAALSQSFVTAQAAHAEALKVPAIHRLLVKRKSGMHLVDAVDFFAKTVKVLGNYRIASNIELPTGALNAETMKSWLLDNAEEVATVDYPPVEAAIVVGNP